MTRTQFTTLGLAAFALLITAAASVPVLAQGHVSHAAAVKDAQAKAGGASEFVKIVRRTTERYRDPAMAIADGYIPHFGCVTGSHEGAMGVHFVNFPLVLDGVLDPERPELLVYEPLPNGRMRLVAADYLVIAETWDAASDGPPEMMGQLFHYFESPNRFGLPAFYTLHVWAWKDNPQGMFANWNPNVSCDSYEGAQ